MPEASRSHMPDPVPALTLLGFDYGLQRIGVAVGQRISGTARGLTILKARDGVPDWSQVAALIATWQPDALVVGLPLQLDGSASALSTAAERFARRLHGRFGVPVHLQDERLSSHTARAAATGTLTRGKGQDAIDDLAAQIILQDWLDRQGD